MATSFSLVLATAGLLYLLTQSLGLSLSWYAFALSYNSVIIAIKFIISPAFLHNSLGRATPKYIFAGFVVMVLYLVAFWIIYSVYARDSQKRISKKSSGEPIGWPTRFLLGGGLLLMAFAARVLIANLLSGTAASDYLRAIFSGSSLTLPLLLAIMVFSSIGAFEKAGRSAVRKHNLEILHKFFLVGLFLIITYHLLWLVYTVNLFR
ncbi:MAG TPA: hypothetical protein VMT23_01110 [Candidatus Binatia bacterium]|nr:hypothetical protein [Candidatus Binatia bacterium]